VKNLSARERSSTELRFRFVLLLDGVASGGLSRVKMNALRAPLTAPRTTEDKCVFDEADDFIDVVKSPSHKFQAGGARFGRESRETLLSTIIRESA
jgi:hypothetical protein